jgi:hypothetical protein
MATRTIAKRIDRLWDRIQELDPNAVLDGLLGYGFCDAVDALEPAERAKLVGLFRETGSLVESAARLGNPTVLQTMTGPLARKQSAHSTLDSLIRLSCFIDEFSSVEKFLVNAGDCAGVKVTKAGSNRMFD